MKLPILCYHKVGPIEEEGRRLNIDPARLASHVRYFIRRDFQFVLPSELASMWPDRAVCFSFDDAYTSALKNALPVFNKVGVKAAFYVVTSLVGRMSSWDGDCARPLAPWKDITDAARAGHEIGNHTVSHPFLAKLSREDQQTEICQAKESLLKNRLSCASLCYPYGSFSAETEQAALAAGYQVALALGKRPATPKDNRLALPRIVVAYGDALPKLLYKIHIRPSLPS